MACPRSITRTSAAGEDHLTWLEARHEESYPQAMSFR
jgi:hypothetical protein